MKKITIEAFINTKIVLMEIIPYIIDLVQCVSKYNPVCAKLGLTCRYAQSEYQKVIHRFSPISEWKYPDFGDIDDINYDNFFNWGYDSLACFNIEVNNVSAFIREFLNLKLDEKNLPFFICFFPYFYCWMKRNPTSLHESVHIKGFSHFLKQSKKNPILGNYIRNFFISQGLGAHHSIVGLVKSSTFADVNCLIKCSCLDLRILPLIEKFIDYPHVLQHLFKMIMNESSRRDSLSLLKQIFMKNPNLLPSIEEFYYSLPRTFKYNKIHDVIIETMHDIGWNKFDPQNRRPIITKLFWSHYWSGFWL